MPWCCGLLRAGCAVHPHCPPLSRSLPQGTEKTEDALNIFLEYVPGGSIASLLAKFGSFKESVIKARGRGAKCTSAERCRHGWWLGCWAWVRAPAHRLGVWHAESGACGCHVLQVYTKQILLGLEYLHRCAGLGRLPVQGAAAATVPNPADDVSAFAA